MLSTSFRVAKIPHFNFTQTQNTVYYQMQQPTLESDDNGEVFWIFMNKIWVWIWQGYSQVNALAIIQN